jgi:hypothetical protein
MGPTREPPYPEAILIPIRRVISLKVLLKVAMCRAPFFFLSQLAFASSMRLCRRAQPLPGRSATMSASGEPMCTIVAALISS